ncbi:MAG: pentapeptide repeat-containing protein [Magnetococcales bacterium]|nr:pentapeptide repeat-containing protein [Magnetococcales bacterium]
MACDDWEKKKTLLYPIFFSNWLTNTHPNSSIRYTFIIFVYATMVAVPPVLLLWIQVRFLPYHSEIITWSHRFSLIADTILLWWFWPKIRNQNFLLGTFTWERMLLLTFWGHASVAMLVFSLFFATIPDEFLDQFPIVKFPTGTIYIQKIFSRNLNVSGETLVKSSPSEEIISAYIQKGETAETAWIDHAVGADLEGRDLRYAYISKSKLYKANLRRAKMQKASLYSAHMQGADLLEARMQDAYLDEAHMQGAKIIFTIMHRATLSNALMQNADLYKAQLQNSSLSNAQLQDANLIVENMQYANLTKATMQGANLSDAQIQNAILSRTDMQRANLSRAYMQGASVSWAKMQGATLSNANMQGTHLYMANMQDVILSETNMQGANLYGANLQGANLYGANLQGANLDKVNLYKTDMKGASLSWSSWRGAKTKLQKSDGSEVMNSDIKQESTDRLHYDHVPNVERLIHVRHDGIFGKANDPEQFELNRAKWLAENVLCTDFHILNSLSESAIHSFQSPLMAKIFIETISKEKSCQEITDNLPDADKKRYQSSVYNLNKYIAEEEAKKGTKPIP